MSRASTERHARFLELLRPLQSELENYARRMLWEPQDSADALQNAVLRAFRAFDRYREDASFRGWMYRIVTNEVHALNRRHSRRAKFEFQLSLDELHQLAADTPSAGAWQDNLGDTLTVALQSLSDHERSVLLLRGISGLAYNDIAAALEMPLGSVMGYLSRARQKMRAALATSAAKRRAAP